MVMGLSCLLLYSLCIKNVPLTFSIFILSFRRDENDTLISWFCQLEKLIIGQGSHKYHLYASMFIDSHGIFVIIVL